MLENSAFVSGRLKEKSSTSKGGPFAVFGYSVNGVYYDLEVWGNFTDSTNHDYYCIEYSIDNPSVAQLAERSDCW